MRMLQVSDSVYEEKNNIQVKQFASHTPQLFSTLLEQSQTAKLLREIITKQKVIQFRFSLSLSFTECTSRNAYNVIYGDGLIKRTQNEIIWKHTETHVYENKESKRIATWFRSVVLGFCDLRFDKLSYDRWLLRENTNEKT